MTKQILIILTIFSFAFTSATIKQEKPAYNFQTRVTGFLKKQTATYTIVPETFNTDGNDFVLDKKVNTLWHKTVTLKRKSSFKNSYNQKVYQRLFLSFYQYDTELQCALARESLLNCYGTDCSKIKWGESEQSVKTTPRIYLINKKEIIVCKIYCEHADDSWTTLKNDLMLTFCDGASGIIDAGCGGPFKFIKL